MHKPAAIYTRSAGDAGARERLVRVQHPMGWAAQLEHDPTATDQGQAGAAVGRSRGREDLLRRVREVALHKPQRQSGGGGGEAGSFDEGTAGDLKCVGHGEIQIARGATVKVKSGRGPSGL